MPSDVRHYLDLCEAGKLYHFLIMGTRWRGSRDQWKSEVWFHFLYGSNKNPKRLAQQGDLELAVLVRYFAQVFPTVDAWVRSKKARNYKKLACDMQRRESTLMIGGVCGRMAREYPHVPIVTIHDSISTTSAYVELVQRMILEEFAKAGVCPKLHVEQYGFGLAAA